VNWWDLLGWTLNIFAAYYGLLAVITMFLVLVAVWAGWARNSSLRVDVSTVIEKSPLAPGVGIIVPAHNEEATICACVESFLRLRYPNFEVVVVNDGSKDGTIQSLHTGFDLVEVPPSFDLPLETKTVKAIYRSRVMPNLLVIDKENGGKSDAINVGVNHTTMDLICVVDADSLIESDALLRIVEPFAMKPELTLAGGGSIRIANGITFDGGEPTEVHLPSERVPRYQVLEYLRSFMLARLPFGRMNASVIISGAFGLFRRKEMLEVDGYDTNTIGEDAELSVRMQRHMKEQDLAYEISFVPDAVCWTECPPNNSVLSRQRARWHQGLCEFLWRHRTMLARPKYGIVGMFGLMFYLLFECLGPAVELIASLLAIFLWIIGYINTPMLILLTIGSILLGLAQSFGALMIDGLYFRRIPRLGQMLRLGAESLLEMVSYRWMTLKWRLKGGIAWMKGTHSWGAMERAGLATAGGAAARRHGPARAAAGASATRAALQIAAALEVEAAERRGTVFPAGAELQHASRAA
jgi:cellulose synthase/poly-beta-1,6-N-acetylglucosamine synthase-like glycosyltransferase